MLLVDKSASGEWLSQSIWGPGDLAESWGEALIILLGASLSPSSHQMLQGVGRVGLHSGLLLVLCEVGSGVHACPSASLLWTPTFNLAESA